MYTNEGYHRPSLASSLNKCLYSKLTILIVALVLLNTLSSGQVVPSAHGSQKQKLPSNTLLPSNAPKEYVIYSVVEGSSLDSENEKIRLHLGMIIAPVDVQEYGGEYTGVEFWRVRMSDTQRVAFMSANPKVCSRPARQGLQGNAIADEDQGSNS